MTALCCVFLQLKPAGVSQLVQRVLDIEGKADHWSLKDRCESTSRSSVLVHACTACKLATAHGHGTACKLATAHGHGQITSRWGQ